MKVLDTSVAVDHLRGADAAVALIRDIVASGEPLVASEVVRFELLAGVRPAELEALESFFAALSWMPVDESVARTAGSLARNHRGAHGAIDDADYLIAATVVVLGAELVTTNVRHFPMFDGLEPPYS